MISPKLRSDISDPLMLPFMVVSCFTGCFSQCVTTLLAVTRLMSFINPFRRIKNKVVKVYLAIYTIFMLIADVVPAILMNRNIYEDAELFLKICFYLNIAHCLVGVICSGISSLYVFLIQPVSHSNTTDTKKQASVTILLMNAVYILTLACALLFHLVEDKIIPDSIKFNTISFLFMPILTSAVNPVIFVVRVKSVRETIEAHANSLRTLVATEKTEKGTFQEEDAGL